MLAADPQTDLSKFSQLDSFQAFNKEVHAQILMSTAYQKKKLERITAKHLCKLPSMTDSVL